MKVIIAGSRFITNYAEVEKAVARAIVSPQFRGRRIQEIVSGGARGVDLLGERYARQENITLSRFLADWSFHGRSAGFRRNEQMAE